MAKIHCFFVAGASWSPLGALLEPSWGPLGRGKPVGPGGDQAGEGIAQAGGWAIGRRRRKRKKQHRQIEEEEKRGMRRMRSDTTRDEEGEWHISQHGLVRRITAKPENE
eukprot:3134177-Pyramimonas_sp.AAC.1